jgi:hypothetical protein
MEAKAMTSVFVLFLTYCEVHPAQVVLFISAVCSCFVQKLDKYPRMHALFSLLAHAGVNVPGVANALARLLSREAVKVAVVATLIFAPLVGLLTGCASLTAQDKTEVATYEGEQMACIAASPKDKTAIDACRAKVRAHWCADWSARFDGGAVCK